MFMMKPDGAGPNIALSGGRFAGDDFLSERPEGKARDAPRRTRPGQTDDRKSEQQPAEEPKQSADPAATDEPEDIEDEA